MKLFSGKTRLTTLGTIFAVVMVVFGVRLIRVQVVQGAAYAELANRQSSNIQVIPAARGEIVDRYGRPMATNKTGFNVVLDKSFLPRGETNKILLRLMAVMEGAGETWTDQLPLEKKAPYGFIQGRDNDIARLKKLLEVESYSTAMDVWYWLLDRYELESYTPAEQRKLAGVRYEMEQRGFNNRTRYTFAEDIEMTAVSKIKEASYELPGVDVQESSIRDYACQDVAPHIVGLTGPIFANRLEEYEKKGYARTDIVGNQGLELAFEDQLRGKNGERQITYQGGEVVDVLETKAPVPGNTLVLTLDRELQRRTQQALETNIKELAATKDPIHGGLSDAGSAVVIDVRSGEILAAANYPSYNLATYNKDYNENANNPLRPFFNRAFTGQYTPGSIFKPVVATGALNEGLISLNHNVFCGRVFTKWPDYQPTCMGYHSDTDVMRALAVSCNIFFYDTGWNLGIRNLDKYAQMFGLGEPTGVEIPEQIGNRPTPEYYKSLNRDWQDADVVMAAIGQGGAYTPVQLANYTAVLANGGKRMQAHLVKSVVSYDFETVIEEAKPTVLQDLNLKPGVSEAVQQGMIDASEKVYGTSYSTFSEYPVTVASKTGTPQTTSSATNAFYIAFAPAEDPQIAVAIVVENGSSGLSCAPIAKAIFDQYFFANQNSQGPQIPETILP